jgi:AraC family transcriptional regulator
VPHHGFVRFDTAPAILVAGIRRHHRMAEAAESITRQWNDFRDSAGGLGTGGRVLGAYCGMSGDQFEYLTGREVRSFEDVPPDVGRIHIPAQSYAVFRHQAHVSRTGETWAGIWKDWLPGSGFEDAETPPFEVYDERFDPDTGNGGFDIWFPIRNSGRGSPDDGEQVSSRDLG